MPSVNLEMVRSMFAAWEQGDFGSAAWADSEIELVMADGPQPGSWTGIAGMAAAWREFLSTWEDGYRTEADEYRELDGERVLVTNYYIGRGKTSGLEVGQIRAKGANIFHLRDGKVTRFVMYWDYKRAFADLGLQEQKKSSTVSVVCETLGNTTPELHKVTASEGQLQSPSTHSMGHEDVAVGLA